MITQNRKDEFIKRTGNRPFLVQTGFLPYDFPGNKLLLRHGSGMLEKLPILWHTIFGSVSAGQTLTEKQGTA